MDTEAIPPAKTDVQIRKDAFLEKYKALIDEFKIDWMSYPVMTPNDKGTWDFTIQTQLADTANQPIKSPFVQQ